MEAFTDFSLILALQALPQFRVKSLGVGFFALFTGLKKLRGPPGRSSAEVGEEVSSWTPAAHKDIDFLEEGDEYFMYGDV